VADSGRVVFKEMVPQRFVALALLVQARLADGFWAPTASLLRATPRVQPPLANAASEDSGFEVAIAQFAPRARLPQVRSQRVTLEQQLATAVADEDYVMAAQLRDDLVELRQQDPAVMAAAMREELETHIRRERYAEAARCRDRLLVLRRFLPQYSLAGLWKGNYPNHGDELVRLSYQGDTLIATKVTGDEHVPAGEVTFRADLTQPSDDSEDEQAAGLGGSSAVGVRVEVLSLAPDGSHEPRDVEQFKGEGRIAARGFRHPHYVPGQLFLMEDDVVGFLWLAIGTFVVFSRVPEDDEPDADAAAANVASLGLAAAQADDDDWPEAIS